MSQNHFVTNLATDFSHHSPDKKKNNPQTYLTLDKRRCKMVARDVHKTSKITCSKNEAWAYSVNTWCLFQFDEPLWKEFLLIKVKETHFSNWQSVVLYYCQVQYDKFFISLNLSLVHGHASIELKYLKSYLFNSIQMIKVET